MSKQNNQPIEKYDSILGILARVFWMLIGGAILLISMVFIVQHKGTVFHAADVVFWGTAAALILTRYLDIKLWNGLTATGLPASMKHWSRYTVFLLVCSTIIWIISHAINYLVVNKWPE